ncbi:MAG: Gfo/Idh/MocA family oxidoreductase [Ruminococcaceae bacterium]|nr:Gfo/Idh/MocA family oxidoreductase [Oscillospiraceae bacterium]
MKKYVIVGTGHRGTQAYILPLVKEVSDCAKLVAACDRNPKRAQAALDYAGCDAKVYSAEEFDKMMAEQKPDGVIVTTMDATHDEYIIRALEAGCDVISEKPMTTDGDKCNAIIEAEKRSGKKVTVTFNCRFMPHFIRIKELLREKVIGDIYSVHFEWMLNTSHGADYFRRWHSRRENSGSLLIHKSTHHFDLMNWWLEDEPVKVNAFGTRRFYTPDHQPHGERCLTCEYKKTCNYALDIENNEFYKKIYLDVEDVDGYKRDRCIFSEEIDIEDTVALNVLYKSGTVMTYSLNAHAAYEGMKVVFNGSEGRIEIVNTSSGAFADDPLKTIKVYNRRNEEISYKMPKNTTVSSKLLAGADQVTKDNLGGHGGSDPVMRAAIFRGCTNDPLGQMADTYAGAMSLGIGAAANVSMKEDRAVYLSEIFNFVK